MSTVTLKGNPVHLAGTMPKTGAAAPDFTLVKSDLSTISKKDVAGKTVILLTVPSVDTGVCATETRKFNEKATSVPGVVVLVASADLPFAIKRFSAAEGIANAFVVSDLRDRDFGRRWGVAIADGPLQGVTARAAFVIDPKGNVAYAELVPEIGQEPNYDAILAAARG
jgi:thiol peroxidase